MGLLHNDSETQRGCLYIELINNYSTDINETNQSISIIIK